MARRSWSTSSTARPVSRSALRRSCRVRGVLTSTTERCCRDSPLSSAHQLTGGRLVISSAARDRIKLAIDQLEEMFHRYDDQAAADVNDSYGSALARGRALGYQEAAHVLKSALHDV